MWKAIKHWNEYVTVKWMTTDHDVLALQQNKAIERR